MARRGRPGARARRLLAGVASHLVLGAGVALMLLPFYWMITTSLKTYDQALRFPPTWLPWPPRWANYAEVWQAPHMARYYFNSALVSVATTAAEVVLSLYGAYPFARLRFLGRGPLFTLLLATLMVPGEMLLVPNYITLTRLRWINTYWALIVPWVTSVFAIFLVRQHLQAIPGELYDAAAVDGCGHGRFLWQVAVPLSRPALATVALLKFTGSWNAFLWPLIVTNTPEMRTVPVGLTQYMQDEGSQYHLWMAAATLALLPVLALFLAAQRHFLAGIARTGLKG